MLKKIFFIIFGLVLLNFSLPAFADLSDKKEDIEIGMTYSDVIKSWGVPKSKQEFEIKREEVWTFADSDCIKFKEGKVSAVTVAGFEFFPESEDLSNENSNIIEIKAEPTPTNNNKTVEEDWGAYEPIKDKFPIRKLLQELPAETQNTQRR